MDPLHITAAGNVVIPAYLVLVEKGYAVTCGPSSNGKESWTATGAMGRFAADDTITLLGLVALAEVRGEQWEANDNEIEDFLARFAKKGDD